MKLFNSMSRKKEEFVPITPGEVKMYCLRPHGLQLYPRGQRPPVHHPVRRAAPLSGPVPRLRRDLRAELHRHRRQDHQARSTRSTPPRGRHRRAATSPSISRTPTALGVQRRRRASPAPPSTSARSSTLIKTSGSKNGLCLSRRERRRVFRHSGMAQQLRPA